MSNAISTIRKLLLSEISATDEVHPRDIERVKANDYFIEMMIPKSFKKKKAEDKKIVKNIMKILIWRNDFGVNDFKPSDFISDIYLCGMFKQGIIPNGDVVLCSYFRRYMKVDEWGDMWIESFVWYIEILLDQMLKEGKKLHFFWDLSNCTMENIDADSALKGVPVIVTNYPGLVENLYYYEMPWLFKPFFKTVVSLLPNKYKQVVKVVSKDDALKIIGIDCLPEPIGTLKVSDFVVPHGLSDIQSVGKTRGIKEWNIKKLQKVVDNACTIK